MISRNVKRGFFAAVFIVASALVFGGGRQEIAPPTIELDAPELTYLSPQNSEGVQDSIEIPITVDASEKMVVKGYRFTVFDENGDIEYQIEERDQEEQRFIDRLLISVGFYKRKVEFNVPDKLVWEATSSAGENSEEGTYTFQLEAWDDEGNSRKSEFYNIIVDNTSPSSEASMPYNIFSPNNDGNKDILIIEQSGSVEQKWQGVIKDSDQNTVITYSWEEEGPDNITWDGTDTENQSVPDGVYSYEISTTDQAGNSFSLLLEDIVVDTRDTPISLARDLAFFSPNDDGSQDVLTFDLNVPVLEGIREWSLTVLDRDDAVKRTFSGEAVIPETITFDGNDDAGRVLPEGTYRGYLALLYTNGNNPDAYSSEFVIDLTPPAVSVRVQPSIFSPNGDGNKDSITVYQESSSEDQWTGTFKNREGEVVRLINWRGKADSQLVWDGRDEENNLLPDGMYTYTLSSRDTAGNYAEAVSQPFEKDTRVTPVSLSIDGTHFSPNSDGIKDTITLNPEFEDPRGIESLRLTVLNTAGKAVRTFQTSSAVTALDWDGRDENRRIVPDGEYSAKINVVYINGNNPTASAGPMFIDTSFPTLSVSAEYKLFSPDNDGKQDTVTIFQRNSSEEILWKGEIMNEENNTVKTLMWKGKADEFVWNGKDEEGNRLPDGEYDYTIAATDQAGNFSEFSIRGITIDTRPTPVTLKIETSAFSPNDDNIQDVIQLFPELEIRENIDTWTLNIIGEGERVVRTFKGDTFVPENIAFDGKDDTGITLPEGTYRGKLSVLYKNGNNPSEFSPEFILDVTAPSASARVDFNLFSPNNDGNKDQVSIIQKGSTEDEWTGEITDSRGMLVRTYSWFGALENTVWDGKDDSGKTVPDGTFSYRTFSTDKAGNRGESNRVAIEKDTRPTPLSLSIDLAYFSPNGDRVKDTVKIHPEVGLKERIESYTFIIRDNQAEEVFREERKNVVPRDIVWDGRNMSKQRVPDGRYYAEMNLVYKHGNRPSTTSNPFFIDTQKPTIRLSSEYSLFSPDGDGRRDTVTIVQESSTEDLWEGSIVNDKNQKFRSYFWKGTTDTVVWDGKDDNGNLVEDGTYKYRITSTDKAGNSVTSVLGDFIVDTRVTSAFVSISDSSFSPNGDGFLDTVTLNLYKSLSEGITGWQLSIKNSLGNIVKTFPERPTRTIPASITWNGRDNSGKVIDGTYTASLTIEYEKGNLVDVTSDSEIILDNSPPSFVFTINPIPFSPDNDGIEDTVTLAIRNVTDVSPIEKWSIVIRDPFDRPFKEFSGTRRNLRPVVWDGFSSDGELVQAAEDYKAEITVSDSLGNSRVRNAIIPVDILVFKDGENYKIRISSIQFAPNSPDFLLFDEEKAEKNMKTLTRLAEILDKYSNYRIRIEGHAVSVYWDNPQQAQREEEEELKPLSKARAEAVKDVLVGLGIEESRMSTIGMGGTQPVVPHGDLENRWKSRRVEFILIKN